MPTAGQCLNKCVVNVMVKMCCTAGQCLKKLGELGKAIAIYEKALSVRSEEKGCFRGALGFRVQGLGFRV